MRACVVLLVLGLGWGTSVAGPLDEPWFSAKPAALLAASSAELSTDAPVVVLRNDVHITLDEQGRRTDRSRIVALIVKPAAVDDWGTVFVPWRPFYQEKPTIRARVITRDGKVAELDLSLILDQPAKSESASIFSDRRLMKAPLPRLAVGAVIEEEFVTVDREPLLAGGVVDRHFLTRSVPVRRMVMTVDAPSTLPARVALRGLARTAKPPRKVVRGDRTIWTLDVENLPADDDPRLGIPADVTVDPYLAFATGASWSAVAASYDRAVAARLAEPFTPPAGLKGASPGETVERTLAWLHAHVRYTGIELADSAIVPHPPAQTVARGFGDCKDKATLLVAMLRAAGIDADLALLATGPGTDVDTDLPGMGLFDHAIVRARVGGKDVWIDATEQDLPAGQLPSRDQGRRALIIEPTTRALVVTPVAAPIDNLVREVRTYHLAESAFARVTEVTRESGVFRTNFRNWLRDTPRAEAAESLRDYADDAYGGTLVRFSGSSPATVADPFDLTVEVERVRRAHTERQRIDIYLHRTDTMSRIGDAAGNTGPEVTAAMARRTVDYVWAAPHVYEIENRLEIPPGFDLPSLPARDHRALGTASLTTTRRLDGRTLVITYRFDSGKRRITAAELRTMRAAIEALRGEDAEHVTIAQTGAALIAKGKLREAIAEYQRMIALHPREAVHHGELADAYRHAGMLPAARRAARAAVAVEPTSSDAHVMLGFMLRRDSVGREAGYDADRAGAIAAYRRAIELDPSHIGAHIDLGSLLAMDARGWPSTSPKDLREAASLFRRAYQLGDDPANALAAAEALLMAGDPAAAEAEVRPLPASVMRSTLLVAATAAGKSPREAVALAATLATGDARRTLIVDARAALYRARRYEPMRGLHAELAGTIQDPGHDALMKAMKVFDLSKLAAADPVRPVMHMMARMVDAPPPGGPPPWSKEMGLEIDAVVLAGARQFQHALRTASADVARDTILSAMNPVVHGDATNGWQVHIANSGGRAIFHVQRTARGAELIAMTGSGAGFGRQIRAALARKDLALATRWLDRVDDVAPEAGSAMEVAATLFQEAVTPGAPAKREVLEVAGALLIAQADPAAAIPVLRTCAVTHAATRAACSRSLLGALQARKAWKELAELTRTLPTEDPDELVRYAVNLARIGAVTEGLALLDRALRRTPDHERAIMMRAILSIDAVGWPAAQDELDRVVARPTAPPPVLNWIAWIRLFHDAKPDRAVELGQRAERLSKDLSPELANTLATLAAEADQPYQALKYLEKSHARLLSEPPHSTDWYPIGRIAEGLGLRDDAIVAYRNVAVEDPQPGTPTAYDFAQRALKRLGTR